MQPYTVFLVIFTLFKWFNAEELLESDRERLLKEVNHMRRMGSLGLQISNMQKMYYDIALENKLKRFDKCDDVMRQSPTVLAHSLKAFINGLEEISKPIESQQDRNNADLFTKEEQYGFFEDFINPIQSSIACVDLDIKCPFPHNASKIVKAICVLNPESIQSKTARTYGAPGSNCIGEVASSGLCKS